MLSLVRPPAALQNKMSLRQPDTSHLHAMMKAAAAAARAACSGVRQLAAEGRGAGAGALGGGGGGSSAHSLTSRPTTGKPPPVASRRSGSSLHRHTAGEDGRGADVPKRVPVGGVDLLPG